MANHAQIDDSARSEFSRGDVEFVSRPDLELGIGLWSEHGSRTRSSVD